MLRKLRERIQSEEKGFTLIELLVVILIIGILAAIAIPAFLGQREKAQDSEGKTAVRTAASSAKSYFTDAQTYVGMTKANLTTIEPSLGQGAGNTLTVTVTDADTMSLEVTVAKTSSTFKVTDDAGVATRTCTTGGQKGCPTGGVW